MLLLLVFLIETHVKLLILLLFLPWVRLLLMFFLLQVDLLMFLLLKASLLSMFHLPFIVPFVSNLPTGVIFSSVVPSPSKLVAHDHIFHDKKDQADQYPSKEGFLDDDAWNAHH